MYENPAGERDSTSRDASYGVTCILLVACPCSSACATVINGATQRVAVMSDPPGAQLYINDTPVGVTPAFIDVSRRDADLELRFEKDGCDPAVLTLKRSRSWWSAANVLFAGVPINDYSTGAWMGAMVFYGVLGALVGEQPIGADAAYTRGPSRDGPADQHASTPGFTHFGSWTTFNESEGRKRCRTVSTACGA